MTASPFISVILPVYNAGSYLRPAIESILDQTYNHFELILIDDGSTDSSLNIIYDFAAKDNRIRAYSNPRNCGLVFTLNRGLELAKGDLIARMDADDICHAERFERQIAYFASHPDTLLLGTWAEDVNDDLDTLEIRKMPLDHEALGAQLTKRNAFYHGTVMFRNMPDLRYRQEYYPAEDYDLWCNVFRRGRVAHIPDILFRRRVHSESITQNNYTRVKDKSSQVAEEHCRFLMQSNQQHLIFAAWLMGGTHIRSRVQLRNDLIMSPVTPTSRQHCRLLLNAASFPGRRLGSDIALYIRHTGLLFTLKWLIIQLPAAVRHVLGKLNRPASSTLDKKPTA